METPLTLREVAAILHISPFHVWLLLKAGRLKSYKSWQEWRVWIVDAESVREFAARKANKRPLEANVNQTKAPIQ